MNISSVSPLQRELTASPTDNEVLSLTSNRTNSRTESSIPSSETIDEEDDYRSSDEFTDFPKNILIFIYIFIIDENEIFIGWSGGGREYGHC